MGLYCCSRRGAISGARPRAIKLDNALKLKSLKDFPRIKFAIIPSYYSCLTKLFSSGLSTYGPGFGSIFLVNFLSISKVFPGLEGLFSGNIVHIFHGQLLKRPPTFLVQVGTPQARPAANKNIICSALSRGKVRYGYPSGHECRGGILILRL